MSKKKIDKSKIAVKVVAAFFAGVMVLGVASTCIFAIISLIK